MKIYKIDALLTFLRQTFFYFLQIKIYLWQVWVIDDWKTVGVRKIRAKMKTYIFLYAVFISLFRKLFPLWCYGMKHIIEINENVGKWFFLHFYTKWQLLLYLNERRVYLVERTEKWFVLIQIWKYEFHYIIFVKEMKEKKEMSCFQAFLLRCDCF